MNTDRKMATVRKIAETKSIGGADKICAYRVDGWWVVDSIDKYKVDDIVVYAEPDSWVPHSVAPFLTKPGQFPKVYNEVSGQRLRTIKLRGQISQGLLLPMSIRGSDGLVVGALFTEGDNVTEFLGVQKWEPPAEFRAANAKGSFPHFIPKTDQERIQNLSRSLEKWSAEEHQWQCTEKIDGSSMTVFYKDGEVGVCSRNLELKDDGTSTFWETAKAEGLVEKLISIGKNIALQGELIGGNIQGNAYKADKFQFHLYDIFDIDKQEYYLPSEAESIAEHMDIRHVPVLNREVVTRVSDNNTIDNFLQMSEGKSAIGAKPEREGLVFKSLTEPGTSFKVVSNKWLLKNEG